MDGLIKQSGSTCRRKAVARMGFIFISLVVTISSLLLMLTRQRDGTSQLVTTVEASDQSLHSSVQSTAVAEPASRTGVSEEGGDAVVTLVPLDFLIEPGQGTAKVSLGLPFDDPQPQDTEPSRNSSGRSERLPKDIPDRIPLAID